MSRKKHTKRQAFLVAVALSHASTLNAADCSQLHEFADPLVFPALEFRNTSAQCTMSIQGSGARGKLCEWVYPYRSGDAVNIYQEITQDLRECFENNALLPDDQQVNHPDSYALFRVAVDGYVISASLKDKGALQETYVFVRLGPADE